MLDYTNTILWKKTLGNDNKEYSSEIETLRVTYGKLRENVSYLVSRISNTLPELTLHDITHLDALWDISSLIVGENFPINPLEGFVLGSAILLHDSALCFEAYKNGQDGVRATPQWRDSFLELCEQKKNENIVTLQNEADFISLRELHAKQAETLLSRTWADPDKGENLYLLENASLRKHFGKLIGQIAESHHWDIENLKKLIPQQNTLPEYPREWRINPIKLACILRCADAVHIDNLRAPDFLYALLKRNGISFNHWQAQNRLSKVDLDILDSKKETILFTSTIDFSEEDASSWFVIYDAIKLAEKEIKSSNLLLSSLDERLSFQIKKIVGSESPEQLMNYIRTNNWKPCAAQVHVTNIERLIQNLGGEMLYGAGSDLLEIVIRELIQNSRDAIYARSFIEKTIEGKVLIKIEENENDVWLIIEDNGIGMSERVLTGPLLDFGTSFWSSDLVKSEFPGLRSSSFKPIGKFGIGFYSVFMIADQVYINSREWDKGLIDINQLKFNNGFGLRPIIKTGKVVNFSSLISTQIKLKLKDKYVPQDMMVEIKTNRMGSSNYLVPFNKYLSAICAGIDVPVYLKDRCNEEIQIHQNINCSNFDKKQWLKDISFSEYRDSDYINNYIENNFNRLTPIFENGQLHGLAAISTVFSEMQSFLSIPTVSGLAHTVHTRDAGSFIGFIDFLPKSAKREIGDYSSEKQSIRLWAVGQLEQLKHLELNPIEKYLVASSLCHFEVDPTTIAEILIILDNESRFFSFSQLANLSKHKGIAFLKSDIFKNHIDTNNDINNLPGYALVKPLNGSSFLNLKLIDDQISEQNNSILDCLCRSILAQGLKPQIRKLENIGKNTFGSNMSALIVTSY